MNTPPPSLQADDMLLAPEWLLLDSGLAQGMAVRVRAGRFEDVGPLAELRLRHPTSLPVELPRRLLMPGFIDTHHHLTQSFGKSLAFGEPSEIFRRIWVPLEGSLDERGLYLAAKLAALEALRGGFTTACDAGTRSELGVDTVAQAVTDAGLRCVLGLICNDAGVTDTQPLIEAAERHLARWDDNGLVHPSLAISIPEAATDGMLARVAALCAQSGAPFQTHVNEHTASLERSIIARGLRPIEVLEHAGALGPHALLAHATLLTPREMRVLRDTGSAVSYCPVASIWKGNAVAQAGMLSELGVPVGLGSDGTRGDAFRLMDAAETCQRFAYGLAADDFSCGGGWQWLEAATAGGARAAGLGERTGRIAPGLAADFLLLDLDVPELLPSWDLAWELVRLANRDQIEAVYVAGKMRLWRGWPLDWDARALMQEVAAIARDTLARAPIVKLHPVRAVR
ncbi:MAG: amidohydrolase family protein [Pigmentiphaga sp.]|uniref:amidohydrolase family protein n=1 Tax=Pigmentiphaga sp. TaxID=1977564 RepID=UPI0029B49705|nr:amidohydrolase family protein [Pigmentiphaga sp.]MDX3905658.1 amidohydrolase family protein [Pigmentiphaga sp.]